MQWCVQLLQGCRSKGKTSKFMIRIKLRFKGYICIIL
jgi:hypothetical protein